MANNGRHGDDHHGFLMLVGRLVRASALSQQETRDVRTPLMGAPSHDITFLGNAFMWDLICRVDWVDSIITINCEAASDERSEGLGEGVRILAAIGTVWVSKIGV